MYDFAAAEDLGLRTGLLIYAALLLAPWVLPRLRAHIFWICKDAPTHVAVFTVYSGLTLGISLLLGLGLAVSYHIGADNSIKSVGLALPLLAFASFAYMLLISALGPTPRSRAD